MLRVLVAAPDTHYIKNYERGGHNERQSAGGGGKEKRNMEEREQKKAKMRRTHTGNSVTANRTKLTNGGFLVRSY